MFLTQEFSDPLIQLRTFLLIFAGSPKMDFFQGGEMTKNGVFHWFMSPGNSGCRKIPLGMISMCTNDDLTKNWCVTLTLTYLLRAISLSLVPWEAQNLSQRRLSGPLIRLRTFLSIFAGSPKMDFFQGWDSGMWPKMSKF